MTVLIISVLQTLSDFKRLTVTPHLEPDLDLVLLPSWFGLVSNSPEASCGDTQSKKKKCIKVHYSFIN